MKTINYYLLTNTKIKMKKQILLIAAVLITGLSATVMGQATGTTSAAANIVTPILIEETSPLHFGTMAALSGQAGTCILSTDGVRTQTGGVNLSAQAPLASNAAFDVKGAVNTTYAITLPNTITVSLPGGKATMTIDKVLARTTSAASDGLTGTLSDKGEDSFTIGGTLNVKQSQMTGMYTGSFDVTVAYN